MADAVSMVEQYRVTGDLALLRRSVVLLRETLEPYRVVDLLKCLKKLSAVSGMLADAAYIHVGC